MIQSHVRPARITFLIRRKPWPRARRPRRRRRRCHRRHRHRPLSRGTSTLPRPTISTTSSKTWELPASTPLTWRIPSGPQATTCVTTAFQTAADSPTSGGTHTSTYPTSTYLTPTCPRESAPAREDYAPRATASMERFDRDRARRGAASIAKPASTMYTRTLLGRIPAYQPARDTWSGAPAPMSSKVCSTFLPPGRPALFYCAALTHTVSHTSLAECGTGTYSEGEGNTACELCDLGKYQNEESGQASCKSCAEGKYTPTTGSRMCFDCPLGTYAPNQEHSATTCTACAAGKYSASPGATECESCAQGGYCPAPADGKLATSPLVYQQCPAGTWNEEEGSYERNDCKGCVAGKANPVPGSESIDVCKLCVPGTYAGQPASQYVGAATCSACVHAR